MTKKLSTWEPILAVVLLMTILFSGYLFYRLERTGASTQRGILYDNTKPIADRAAAFKFLLSNGEKTFTNVNLSEADLKRIDLSSVDLTGADLSDVDLTGANLSNANLRNTDLRDAYLNDANLEGAILSNSNPSYAFFRGANLNSSIFYDANLSYADLREASLSDTNFKNANLSETNLTLATKIKIEQLANSTSVENIVGLNKVFLQKLKAKTSSRPSFMAWWRGGDRKTSYKEWFKKRFDEQAIE